MLIRLDNAPPSVPPIVARPTTVSVVMMVGNERWCITDAVRSASWADEVVILDTGSTDGTGDLAARAGAKVTREERIVDLGDGLKSIDDFAAARNRAMSLASCEWIVLLDADERFAGSLRDVLEQLPDCVDVAAVALDHADAPELAQNMTRVFRRSAAPRYEHRVHETVETWIKGRTHATIPREAGYVTHLGSRKDIRAKHRRDERNWRLIQRALADDPNDVHALVFAVEMLCDTQPHHAAVLAEHAWQHVTPEHPSRFRLTLARVELAHRAEDVQRMLAIFDEAAKRWPPNANVLAGHGLALRMAGRPEESRAVLGEALGMNGLAPVMRAQAERHAA